MNEMEAIESTYFDKCTVYRDVEITNEWNETIIDEHATIYKNISCAISKNTLATTSQTDTANTITYSLQLFLNPLYIIEKGDEIEVTYQNRTIKTVAGQHHVYPSHQEVILKYDGEI
ncbi:hypothetical protein [Bacillus massiliigorillae]|uniref:hypothetical protein n=1 Tax=Bacillus massiliigorillae TaxID=1243664 RepID=UPI0003A2462D|nr:hypothetical protein [Bacillus massiliigorillae]